MKRLLLGFIVLASISAFAGETFRVMPIGALRTGTLPLGSYVFNKVEYRDHDGHQPREELKVILEVFDIKQQKFPEYTQYVGELGSENMARATDIKTTIKVKITDGKKTFNCSMSSRGLQDFVSDSFGFDDASLRCSENSDKRFFDISLIDYSYRVPGAPMFYELVVSSPRRGLFGSKITTFSAEIVAQ